MNMRSTAARVAIVAAAIAVIYHRSTAAYFFDDDFHWLEQTQHFTPAGMLELSRYNHFYRPVIETYFFVGLSLFGCNPFPFHVASIALHAATTLVVYAFARELRNGAEGGRTFAFLSALFFAVQPGLVDAVTWIGAITDLLPAPFYVLALWFHLRFLRLRRWPWYAAALAAFVACHLTHESAATLLPMLLLVDGVFVAQGTAADRIRAVSRRWLQYAPFAVLLLGYLALAYVVNTRGYLVQEGHYALGWHAVPNILNYVIWLYVGRRSVVDYVVMIAALGAIVAWGGPRQRFSVVWIVLTLLPVSFFTWDNAARYLYLPAVGFSMLAADLLLGLRNVAGRRLPARTASLVTLVVVAALAARFGSFAKKAADSFPARTASYARFVHELRRSNPEATPGATVFIDQRYLDGVPELYRQPAARVGLCVPDVVLQMR